MLTVYTFGDSILDCSHFNDRGVDPGRLLINNNNSLFPEFEGRDLCSATNDDAVLELRAYDGSVVNDLAGQIEDLEVEEPAIAILTIGGTDLLDGLLEDDGSGIEEFARKLKDFLESLPIRPVLVATVYDPTFGDDSAGLFGDDPALARSNLAKINTVLTHFGQVYGATVDLHAHFQSGEPNWVTNRIEPSLVGVSEVRRCFLEAIETHKFVS